jgi:hypothetical protein
MTIQVRPIHQASSYEVNSIMKKTILLITAMIIIPAISRGQDTTSASILQPVTRDSVKIAEKPIPIPKIDLIEVKNAAGGRVT